MKDVQWNSESEAKKKKQRKRRAEKGGTRENRRAQ